jgi:hypothetical protein
MYKKYYTDYYEELFGGKKHDDYVIYGDLSDDSSSLSYDDIYNEIIKHFNVKLTEEESEEQKSIRLAKEKAEKRNSKIDQILGE